MSWERQTYNVICLPASLRLAISISHLPQACGLPCETPPIYTECALQEHDHSPVGLGDRATANPAVDQAG
jgi:hypothetical protein